MGLVKIDESILTAIAGAIRSKLGVATTYKPNQMASAIGTIEEVNASKNGQVVVNGHLANQTSKSITENGTHDTTTNNSVTVNVEHSFVAEDEGKVVSNGALVAQSSQNITQNGTYDTTLKNEVVVNVSGGGSTLVPKTITQDGVYNPADDNADGYSQVTVNVGGGSSENDLLYHFENDYNNSGKSDAVFFKTNGLTISNEQSKFGSYSLKCGTSQEYYNIATPYDFELGSDDFTLDFWVYPTNLVAGSTFKVPFACNYRSIAFYLSQTLIEFGLSKNGSSWFNVADISADIANNEWHHIALVRDGTNIYGFVDGERLQTINFGNDSIATMNTISIGSNTYDYGDRRFQGYIDELRIIKGEAVWTDDFTPPTQPYE